LKVEIIIDKHNKMSELVGKEVEVEEEGTFEQNLKI